MMVRDPKRSLRLFGLLLCLGCSDSSNSNGGNVLLYVVNTGTTTVSVIDHQTREVTATLDVGGIAHGQIPSSTGDRMFVCTEDTGEVLAIDTRTQEILWRVTATENTGDLLLQQPSLTPDDRILFCPEALAGRMVVVNVQTQELLDPVPIFNDSDPERRQLAGLHNSYLSGDGRFVFVEAILSERIAKVDVETREIVQGYPINGQPRPFAVTSDDSVLYLQLTDLEGFVVIDIDSGQELRRIEFGNEPTRVWEETNTLLKPKSHGIGLNPSETELWATSTMADEWRVYSVPDLNLMATIPIPEGNAPNWIAFTPDGEFAYVSNTTFVPDADTGEPAEDVPGTVTVINANTYEVERTITVGPLPKRIHAVTVP